MSHRTFDRWDENRALELPSPFAPSEVLSHLVRPQAVKDLPATVSLERQLRRIAAHVAEHRPRLSEAEEALCIAHQFLEVSIHNRTSQQAMFGPKPHEREESPEELARVLPETKRRGEDVFTRLRERVLQGRPATLDRFVDGWMYLTQGKPGKTAYRIYLAPKLPFAAGIFAEIARDVPASVAYQMKTLSPALTRPEEFGRGDKIVIYPSEETLPTLLKVVEAVCKRHPTVFEGRLPPGGGVYCPCDGVSITYDPPRTNGQKSTGTAEIAKVIDQGLKERSLGQLKAIVQGSFKSMEQFTQSIVGKMMWKALVFGGDWLETPRVGRWTPIGREKRYQDAPLNEDDQVLSKCYYLALYEEWILSLKDNRPVDHERIQQDFLRRIQQEMVLYHLWNKRMQEKGAFDFGGAIAWPGGMPSLEAAAERASLAASIYKRKKQGEDIEDTLGILLGGKSYKPQPRES